MFYAILILTNFVTLIGLLASVRRSLELVEKMDDVSNQIEESLDMINDAYASVSRHLESPVLFDDPVVIAMINDVKYARDAMLLIANKAVEPFPDEADSDEENET